MTGREKLKQYKGAQETAPSSNSREKLTAYTYGNEDAFKNAANQYTEYKENERLRKEAERAAREAALNEAKRLAPSIGTGIASGASNAVYNTQRNVAQDIKSLTTQLVRADEIDALRKDANENAEIYRAGKFFEGIGGRPDTRTSTIQQESTVPVRYGGGYSILDKTAAQNAKTAIKNDIIESGLGSYEQLSGYSKERAKQDAYDSYTISQYNPLKNNPDFSVNSKYKEGENQTLDFLRGRMDSKGKTPNAIEVIKNRMAGISNYGTADQYITEEQFAMLNYVYHTMGEDEMLKLYEAYKNPAAKERMEDLKQEATEFAEKLPTLATFASTPIKIAGGIEALPANIANLFGANISTNDDSYSLSQFAKTARGTVQSEYASKWFKGATIPGTDRSIGESVYGILTSSLDSAANFVASMGIGNAIGAANLIPEITSAIMGSQVFADTVIDDVESGRDVTSAAWDGLVSAAIEGITEKYSIEAIMAEPTSFVRQMAKSFLAEGSEEVSSNWLGRIANIIESSVEGRENDFNKKVNSLVFDDGMSVNDAIAKVIFDNTVEDGEAFLSGGLSGLLMGGAYKVSNTVLGAGKSAVNAVKKSKFENKVSRDILSAYDYAGFEKLLSEGLESDKESDAYKTAAKMQDRYNSLAAKMFPDVEQLTADDKNAVYDELVKGNKGKKFLVGVTAKSDEDQARQTLNIRYGTESDSISEAYEKAGVDKATAEMLEKAYEGGIAKSVYALETVRAYEEGKVGLDLNVKFFDKNVSDRIIKQAYDMGKMNADSTVPTSAANVKAGLTYANTEEAVKNLSSLGIKNAVAFDVESLDESQKAQVKYIGKLAEVMNLPVVMYQSATNQLGEHVGQNGAYDPNTNTIYLDVSAGTSVESKMTYTVAHELTHFVKQWSPEKFNALRDFLYEQYKEKGKSAYQMIVGQMSKANTNGRKITFEKATEEFVADSMEKILSDPRAAERIAELRNKDKTLWQKIKTELNRISREVKKILTGVDPDSEEGKFVASLGENIDKLRDLFAEGVADAANRRDAAVKTEAKESESVKTTERKTIDKTSEKKDVSEIVDELVDRTKNLRKGNYEIPDVIQRELWKNGYSAEETYRIIQRAIDKGAKINSFGSKIESIKSAIANKGYEFSYILDGLKEGRFDRTDPAQVLASNFISAILDADVAAVEGGELNKADIDKESDRIIKEFNLKKSSDSIIVRFSDRDTRTERQLLADALASVATTEADKRILEQYRIDADEAAINENKAAELREKAQNAPKGKKQIDLYHEAKLAEEAATRAEKKLVTIEAMAPMQKLLDTEVVKATRSAYEKANVKKREALNELRERKNNEIAELKESKKEAVRKVREAHTKKEARENIESLTKEITKELTHPTNKKYIPKGLVQPMLYLLTDVNFDNSTKKSYKLLDKIAEAYEMYRPKADGDFDNAYAVKYDETVAEGLNALKERIGNTPINEMTVDELNAVYKTMRALYKMVGEQRRLHWTERNESAYEISEKMQKETASAKQQIGAVTKYIEMGLRPETLFKMFGNFTKDSAWDSVYKMLDEGQLRQMEFQQQASQLFREVVENKKEAAGLRDKVTLPIKDSKGRAITVSRGMMLSLYMSLLDEDNAADIMQKGAVIANADEYYNPSKRKDAYNRDPVEFLGGSQRLEKIENRRNEIESEIKLDGLREATDAESKKRLKGLRKEQRYLDEERESILRDLKTEASKLAADIYAQMTDYEKRYCELVRDYYDNLSKDALNEVTEELYGFSKARVKNYYPVKVDPNSLFASFDSVQRDFRLENAGFMKERQNVAKPIVLEDISDVVNRSIEQTAQYVGYLIPLDNFNKIYNYGNLRKTIQNRFGKQGVGLIENLIADINGARHSDSTRWDRLRGNFAGGVLTLNPRVAMAQTASFPTAIAELDLGSDVKALFKGGKNDWMLSKADKELIAKYSPLLWYRMQGFADPELGDIKKMADSGYKLSQKMKWATGWINFMDGATVGRLWYASQYYVDKHNSNITKGTDAYYKEVAKVFNRVVEKTQPNYTTLQRPDILRSTDGLVRQLTMFMTQRLQNANILYEAVMTQKKYESDFKQNENGVTKADVKEARMKTARALGSQFAATMTLVAFKLFADMLTHTMNPYRDDDDELTAESIVNRFGYNMLESFASNFIGGAELFSFANAFIGNGQYDGLSVNSVEAVNDAVKSIASLGSSVKNWIEEDREKYKAQKFKTVEKNAMNVALESCYLLGIPATNAKKLVAGIVNHVKDLANGEPFSFEAGTYSENSKPKPGRLYTALVEKDSKRIELYRKVYADDKAYKSAVKSALYEGDERITEAARAFSKKDLTTYKRLVKQIVSEGVFTQDDVVGAMGKAITYLNNITISKDDDSLKPSATNDIKVAMEAGDYDIVEEFTWNLIESKMDEGKSQKDAISAVKSSMTSYLKPLYTAAFGKGDKKEMERIIKCYYSTGIFESYEDAKAYCEKWVK